jgi:hypothetical protein
MNGQTWDDPPEWAAEYSADDYDPAGLDGLEPPDEEYLSWDEYSAMGSFEQGLRRIFGMHTITPDGQYL